MKYSPRFLLTLIFPAIFPAIIVAYAAQATADSASHVTLIRQGKSLELSQSQQLAIAAQLSQIYDSCAADTTEHWVKKLWERQGKTLAELWLELNQGSHFSLKYPELDRSKKELPITAGSELVLSIDEAKLGLGMLMSKSFAGTIRGYIKCSADEQLQLLCLPELKQLLPIHYRRRDCSRFE